MKKSAILAGFLAAIPLATTALQHTVLAMELSSFNIGDIAINNKHSNLDSNEQPTEQTGEVLSESTEAEPEAKPEPKKLEKTFVTVTKGDNLSKIAKAHKTTVQRLFDANGFIKNPDIINPGDKVRIPFADEKLAKRPMPVAPAPKPAAKTTARRSSYKRIQTNAPAVASGSVWDRLAACESGGNWSINTGNGYYGGLQFLPSTWRAVGGTGLPHQHSREEQIKRAEILLARSGWGQWPACTAKLGLR